MSPVRPLIAIVTPVYNGGKFLAGAMEAVQAQTYRPLIHVVLDNSSTDDTAAIIARFQNRDVPIVTKRNGELLPAPANWSEAVRMVPAEAGYFKILCADDGMTPNAIEKLVKTAQAADDVRVVGAPERLNGVTRSAHIPSSSDVFEASNMLARIFADSAGIPYHHLMYRIDTQDNEPFFRSGAVSFDAEAAFRVLSRGGRVGWVHEPLFDTLAHGASLTSTWTNKVSSEHWEHLTRIEVYGPGALSSAEYRRILRGQLLRVYRRLLWRFIGGRVEVARRDLELLRGRNHRPSLLDYVMSILTWPWHYYYRRVIWPKPPAEWPAIAAKPTDGFQATAAAQTPTPRAGRPSGLGVAANIS